MYDIVKAKYIEDFKVELTFENGRKGVVDFKGYAEKGGVFTPFADLEYFKQFSINREIGALCWPGGLDIAPEVLYHEATGEPLPEWMDTKEDLKAV